MKTHLVPGAIAAAVAASVSVGGSFVAPKSAARHAWPVLSDQEKTTLAAAAKTLPAGIKVDIVCNTASCDELAEDLDDAFEAAGIDSSLDHAVGPMGYGAGIQVNEFDRPAAEKAAAILKTATKGWLDAPIVPGKSPPGYVVLLIGKYRPPGR